VPVTDISPPLKAGPARFAEIPQKQQLKVLGPLKFEAYQTGRISLQDLVGTSTNKQWGTSLRERSLKDALIDPRGVQLPQLPKRTNTLRRQAA
jgi:hypothetical protein